LVEVGQSPSLAPLVVGNIKLLHKRLYRLSTLRHSDLHANLVVSGDVVLVLVVALLVPVLVLVLVALAGLTVRLRSS